MSRRCQLARTCVLVVAFAAAGLAAEPALTVPPEAAKLLNQVAALNDPRQAEALLVAYAGAPNAVVFTALGNARLQLAEQVEQAERAGLHARAREAYAQAVLVDPSLPAPQIGLARCAALVGKWSEAVAACVKAIHPDVASSGDLAFYIDCAQRAGDNRLATVLVTQAIPRHPGELVFRRQEVALLVESERWTEARAAALALLARTPEDSATWQGLAGIAARSGEPGLSREALTAALLAHPDDVGIRRALATAQVAGGQAPAAVATLAPLLTDAASADPALVELAARAAIEADRAEQARRWLRAIPAAKRSRGGQLLVARLAVQADDVTEAQAALAAALQMGEPDPAIITWAGALAERSGDTARAEALYRQAESQTSTTAGLRLALLLQRTGRHDEARAALAVYRKEHPGDPQLVVIERIIDGK